MHVLAQVTDVGLCALSAARPELEALYMDECLRVTDEGVVAIANGCKHLQVCWGGRGME